MPPTQGLYSCNNCLSSLHGQLVPPHWIPLVHIQKGYSVSQILKNPPLILESPETTPLLRLPLKQNSFKELSIFSISNSSPLIFILIPSI